MRTTAYKKSNFVTSRSVDSCVSCSLPPDLYKKFDALCRERGMNLTGMLRELVRQAVEQK